MSSGCQRIAGNQKSDFFILGFLEKFRGVVFKIFSLERDYWTAEAALKSCNLVANCVRIGLGVDLVGRTEGLEGAESQVFRTKAEADKQKHEESFQ